MDREGTLIVFDLFNPTFQDFHLQEGARVLGYHKFVSLLKSLLRSATDIYWVYLCVTHKIVNCVNIYCKKKSKSEFYTLILAKCSEHIVIHTLHLMFFIIW